MLFFGNNAVFYSFFVFGGRHSLIVLSEHAAEVVAARNSYLIRYLGDRAISVAEYLLRALDAVVVEVIYGSCLHVVQKDSMHIVGGEIYKVCKSFFGNALAVIYVDVIEYYLCIGRDLFLLYGLAGCAGKGNYHMQSAKGVDAIVKVGITLRAYKLGENLLDLLRVGGSENFVLLVKAATLYEISGIVTAKLYPIGGEVVAIGIDHVSCRKSGLDEQYGRSLSYLAVKVAHSRYYVLKHELILAYVAGVKSGRLMVAAYLSDGKGRACGCFKIKNI